MFLKKDPIDAEEYKALSETYAAKVMGSYGRVNSDIVIAVAGTPTTLVCVDKKINFNEHEVEGGRLLTRKENFRVGPSLGEHALRQERKQLKGLEPLRADVDCSRMCPLANVCPRCRSKRKLSYIKSLPEGFVMGLHSTKENSSDEKV